MIVWCVNAAAAHIGVFMAIVFMHGSAIGMVDIPLEDEHGLLC